MPAASVAEVGAPEPDTLDLAALQASLAALDAREAQLDAQLATIRLEAYEGVRALAPEAAAAAAQAVRIGAELDALVEGTRTTSAFSAPSAAAIRSLHARRAELSGTLTLVDRLLALDEAEASAAVALAGADFETATLHVQSALASVRAAGDAIDAPTRKRIESAHARVLSEVRSRLADALAASVLGPVCRFCRLLTQLGEMVEAHTTLAAFCTKCIDAAAEPTAVEGTQPVLAALPLRLARLLRCTAEAVTGVSAALRPLPRVQSDAGTGESLASVQTAPGDNAAVAEDVAAAQAARELCALLYDRSVEAGSALAAQYAAAAALRSRTASAQRRMGAAVPVGQLPEIGPDAEAEALGCEGLLDELAGLLRGAVQYDAFMYARLPSPFAASDGGAAETRASSGAGDAPTAAPSSTLSRSTGFCDLRAGLQPLSAQQAWAATVKAMRMDSSMEDEAAAGGRAGGAEDGDTARRADTSKTELIDSVFYVLQRYLRRALHTCDGDVAASAVQHASELIGGILLDSLSTPLKQTVSSKLAGAALASAQAMMAEATQGTAASACVSGAMGSAVTAAGASRLPSTLRALNALQLCMSCAPRLFRGAAEDAARELPPDALASVEAQLDAVKHVEGKLATSLNAGLQQLASTIHPRLKAKLDAFRERSYVLGSDEALATAETASFVSPLIAELNSVLSTIQGALNEANTQALLELLVVHIAERIEAHLLLKRVDMYGALLLERDVRTLAQRLSDLSSRSVREPLSRLTQMAMLLSLERESELVDVWSDGGLKLTAADAKKVMGLRVEFRAETIASMPLPT